MLSGMNIYLSLSEIYILLSKSICFNLKHLIVKNRWNFHRASFNSSIQFWCFPFQQEYDTKVYYLNCNELKSVKIPEPVPEAMESADISVNQQYDLSNPSNVTNDAMEDKCTDGKTDESGDVMLAGVWTKSQGSL